MISSVFHVIFYQPLYNALVFIVGVLPWHDVGIAVILLTFVVRGILFPLSHRSIITQRKMREIEPEIKKTKEQFKKDKQEQTKQVMALYKAHGISPSSGFFMLLIQLPILIALYMVFSKGIGFDSADLYSFVKMPEIIRMKFLGLVEISKSNMFLAALAGLTQFLQMKLSVPKIKDSGGGAVSFQDQLARTMNIQARYIMPGVIFFIALKFSSGIALYWTDMNIFAIVHEAIVAHQAKKIQNHDRGIGNHQNNN